jgi:hypothetical protein
VGALLTIAVLVVGACSSSSPPKKIAAPTTSASATPTPAPPPPPPVVWPLTGVPVAAVPARPAVAVKIENSIDARPQTGLNSADMVWEEVVEGGITRYLAVFDSKLPPVIGPVRSVRPMDPSIAAPLHGLFAFSGGQHPFPEQAAASGLQVLSMDAGADGFYRSRARRAPHNVYADLQTFLRQANAGHKAPPPRQFVFAARGEQPTALVSGVPAPALHLTLSRLSHPVWTWSPSIGGWARAENTRLAKGSDGQQLRATNVVVLRVDVVNTRYRDPANNPVPETKLSGTGQAVVATGGKIVHATWAKASVGAVLTLTGSDGAPIRLAPGSTWVELVPNGSGSVR